jgi:hypothetical protein
MDSIKLCSRSPPPSTPTPPHASPATGCSLCSPRVLEGLLAALRVLAYELHLLGEGVGALLQGLALVAVLDGVVVDRYLGVFEALLKRAVLGL